MIKSQQTFNYFQILSKLLVVVCFIFPLGLMAQEATSNKKVLPIPLITDSTGKAKTRTPGSAWLMTNHTPACIGQTFTYIVVTPPKFGKVIMPEPEVYTGGYISVTYISDNDYIGQDSFTWKLNNGSQDTNVATVTFDVAEDFPLPNERMLVHATENTIIEFPALFYGGGKSFTYAIKNTNPQNGTLEVEGLKFKYTPKPNFVGTDSFEWGFSISKGTIPQKDSLKATCNIVVKKKGMKDWPQWRADEMRSGFTTMHLPEKLSLLWQRDIPMINGAFTPPGSVKPRVFPDIDYCRPVQLGKFLYVVETASDSLSAYDTGTGELKWRYYTSGAVRRPPAASMLSDGSKVVIVSSDDGWVYSLNGETGKENWRFRAAPNNQKAMGFGRLSSVWPIWASPAISGDKVFFVAGYIPSYCLYGYCLDIKNGSVVWVNDGRVNDIWNTSALGPIAISMNGKEMYGSVEGNARPWVLDTSTGEFLGHFGLGFSFPVGGKWGKNFGFANRNGTVGWYSDGQGSYNIAEPTQITVGNQIFTFKGVLELGVQGKVASLLAGDDKLFVTTVEGKIYCFGGEQVTPKTYPIALTPLPKIADEYTATVTAMLSRKDLKFGLAYVLGLNNGRIVEELATQSSLSIVVVDPNHDKLQTLRKKMDSAGLSGLRVSTIEGNPMDILFAPNQAAIITSEDLNALGKDKIESKIETLYYWNRPFGGEIWLPTSNDQDAAIASYFSSTKKMPLSAIGKQKGITGLCDNFTQIKRTGLPEEKLKLMPPFGLIAFGSEAVVAPYLHLSETWPGKETYSVLPFKEKVFGTIPTPPKHTNEKGYPTAATVSTINSMFSTMKNPLTSRMEKSTGLTSSGNDGACGVYSNQYGDVGLTHGKISSFFDTSENYYGRLFYPEIGGCPGRISAGNSLVTLMGHPVPGSACGCSSTMQFSSFVVTPMEFEENWFNVQNRRTMNAVEETPIHKIGINFAAYGDRYINEENMLWTHHPYSGRYGRISYNGSAKISALPLVPVSYSGNAKSFYHHSAQMEKKGDRYRGWVAASYVKNMTEINIPLLQPVVALKTTAAPKIDGDLSDACWDGQKKVVFTPDYTVTDPNRDLGVPKTTDECFAMVRYDENNLYIAGGTNVGFSAISKKFFVVTLNSRERVMNDVILTCSGKNKNSIGLAVTDWSCGELSNDKTPYAAEVAIPWASIAKAGLWKEQLIINVNLSDGKLTAEYTPLYYDTPKGVSNESHPYTVRLYFAEMAGKSIGQRLFDVSLQGKEVLKNFDIVKEAGAPKRDLMKEFKKVEITDRLKINFNAIKDEPILGGVEIIGEYNPTDHLPNMVPTAEIEASVISGTAPLKVLFNAQKSVDPDGQIANCNWEFGDGRLAKGSIVEHVYAESGTYQVYLLVRDNRGGMATKQITITVQPGVPAAFICSIKASGGDFTKLSEFETALKSDLTSSSMIFKLTEVGTLSYNNRSVVFTGGASGKILEVKDNMATIANIKGAPAIGKGNVFGNLKFAIGDIGTPLGKSLLFKVSSKENYSTVDNGNAVTFTGGGQGVLKHINSEGLAYITECQGDIQAGKVTLSNGHNFEVSDTGNLVFSIVAECYHDWKSGLEDKVQTFNSTGWVTDALHCVTIRANKGNKFDGKGKDTKNTFASFALSGELDLRGIPNTRIEQINIDQNSSVAFGEGSSVNRCVFGNSTIWEKTIVANSIGKNFFVGNSKGIVNKPVSYFTTSIRDARAPLESFNFPSSDVSFINCTGTSFDPGGQPNVEFINCLSTTSTKPYNVPGYAEMSYINNCILIDGTKAILINGDGFEKATDNSSIAFVNATEGDFHLTTKDTVAKGKGGPGLGADIDGDVRTGLTFDIGADTVKK